MTTPKRVALTGAAGQIGYSLLPRIARGDVFGPGVPIVLQCLEIPPAMDALRGVAMELRDCAFPLLRDIVCTDDPKTAFKDANLVLLVGSKPRGKGMERKDLILENGPIFTGQGRAINDVAGPDVRVLVVGNPCNTNALICMHSAPDVPRERFSAMTRLDQNRAVVQLAQRAGVHWSEVRNVIIWGNHSNTQYPDWHHATIAGQPAAQAIGDDEWLRGPFIQSVQQRGKAIIDARGLSSAMSAANAAIDHASDLFSVKGAEDFAAMAVLSDGSYGTPEGLISSFPCTTDGRGNWSIVQGLEMDPWSVEMKKRSTDELEEEREIVTHLLGS